MDNSPLVSVIVITYNSSEFVVDALDSVFQQNYNNLEIIVSDDCSSDDTVPKVKAWIDSYKNRFVRCVVVESPVNTGTAANNNRAVKTCMGEWIRGLAGDDLLAPEAISSLIKEVDKEKKIVLGASVDFVDKPNNVVFVNDKMAIAPYFFEGSAAFQHQFILYNSDFGLSQGCIIHKDVFKSLLYDERYSVVEDLPFWLNVTKKGYKIWGCSSIVTYYRVHESVSHGSDKKLLNERMARILLEIKKDMILPEIPWYHLFFYETYLIDKLVLWIVVHIFNNRKTFFSHLVIGVLMRLKLLKYYNYFRNSCEIRQWRKNR